MNLKNMKIGQSIEVTAKNLSPSNIEKLFKKATTFTDNRYNWMVRDLDSDLFIVLKQGIKDNEVELFRKHMKPQIVLDKGASVNDIKQAIKKARGKGKIYILQE